jgi:hypothetical protein
LSLYKKDGTVKVDKTGWEKKFNTLQDPWTYVWMVYLYDDLTCEIFTLQLKSSGGKWAWIALVSGIKERRRKYPGANAIVELRWAKMPTREYGEKKKPFFKIVGWKINTDQVAAVQAQAQAQTQDQVQSTKQIAHQLKAVDDIDDELPAHLR